MKARTFILAGIIALFAVFPVSSQETPASPEGNWCMDRIGSSEYFLDITDSTIKYIDKKTENYIIFPYFLQERDGSAEMIVTSISEQTLATEKLNKALKAHLSASNRLPFARNGDKMVLQLADGDVKLVTREHKAFVGKAAAGIGAAVAGIAAAAIIKTETDKARQAEIEELAKRAYQATKKLQ